MKTITSTPRKRRAYTSTGEVGKHLALAGALMAQIRELEAQLMPHREFLLAHMQAKGLTLCEQGGLQAQLKVRHKWTYSAACERDMLAVRQLQQFEQSQGIAQDNPTAYIAITTLKP